MDYLTRSYENLIRQTAASFKSVLVTGARQVGKSTVLSHLFPGHPEVVLDDLILQRQAQDDPALFLMNHPAPVLLDEVQHAPELFPYIKMECDKSDERGRFLLTGSQPLRLTESASESLAGRVGIIEMCGLSLRELYDCDFNGHFVPSAEYIAARRPTVAAPESIWRHIHRGSYPEAQDERTNWHTFYSSYIQTYLERDISKLVNVKDKVKFTTFLQAMAARTGQLLNYDNVADELGVSAPTVRSWTSMLVASGIGLLLQPFSNSALARAVKTPKFYLRDTGLACYLTGWTSPETAATGAMAGPLFETFVLNEIVKSYAAEGIDYRLCVRYYRGRDRLSRKGKSIESEIDLIISENGVNYPIEIKLSASPRKDMADAFDVLDKPSDSHRGPGAIICMHPDAFYLKEGLFVCPPWWL